MSVRTGRWALLALAGMVAACGSSGLETGAGKVDEKTAVAFIASAESDWRKAADTGAASNVSGEARCYFVTASDDEQRSLGTMACGPVRRLGSAEGAVWDLVKIEGTTGSDPGLRIVEGAEWQRSAARPTDGSLTRPDDKAPPADADQLALPPAPPAGSRLVLVQDKPGTTTFSDHNSRLVTPDVTLTLTGLGAADTIGEGAQIKGPAEGEQFVVARFTTAATVDPLSPAAARRPGTTWAVTADSKSTPVNELFDAAKPQTGVRYLVASVPKDAKDVSLTATNGPVVQTLSLQTGERTSTDVAGAYYRPETSVMLDKALPAKRVKVGRDFDATYGIKLTKAALTPWDPERGWAPAGKAWFRFLFDDDGRLPIALYKITWNPRFFTLTADGTPIATPPTGESREGQVIAAPVPADAKTIRITTTATLTFTAHPYAFSATPKSGTANFGTLTTDATFD